MDVVFRPLLGEMRAAMLRDWPSVWSSVWLGLARFGERRILVELTNLVGLPHWFLMYGSLVWGSVWLGLASVWLGLAHGFPYKSCLANGPDSSRG